MRVYEQTLAAYETWENPGGIYFQLISASYAVDVQFYGLNGQPIDSAKSVTSGYRSLRDENNRFRKVDIINGDTPQKIKIAVSDVYGDFNVVSGEVAVTALPQKSDEVLNDVWSVSFKTVGQVTGQYSALQVYNDVASGVNFEVHKILVNDNAATGDVLVGAYDTDINPADTSLMRNMHFLGGSSVLTGVRFKSANSASAYSLINVPIAEVKPQYEPYVLDYSDHPIVIAPGAGMLIHTVGQNKILKAGVIGKQRAI